MGHGSGGAFKATGYYFHFRSPWASDRANRIEIIGQLKRPTKRFQYFVPDDSSSHCSCSKNCQPCPHGSKFLLEKSLRQLGCPKKLSWVSIGRKPELQ